MSRVAQRLRDDLALADALVGVLDHIAAHTAPRGALTRVCPICGGLRGRAPHCDVCRALEITQLCDEIEFLHGTDHPHNLAARLGYTPTALARRLFRAGRHDLARIFDTKEAA